MNNTLGLESFDQVQEMPGKSDAEIFVAPALSVRSLERHR
jgi:hypothetical protein